MTKNIFVPWFVITDFFLWNVYLVVPSYVAISVGARSTGLCQSLKNYIENSSNFCHDDNVFLKVSEHQRKQMIDEEK